MSPPQQAAVRNRLLSGLPPDGFGLLQPHLEPFKLDLRLMLSEPGDPVPFVHFVERGIVSILADTAEGRIEVGMIGCEGLAGLPAVLGIERTPHAQLVQTQGEALRVPVGELRAAMDRSPSVRDRLLRYAHAFMVQTSQTAYANAAFAIEARLARWILMTHDRTGEDELVLTHDFMSMMLGVRRPGVTVAVQVLEGNRLIRATRGRIVVLDRAGLEAVADDAYGLAEAEYASALLQETSAEA